MKNRTLHFLQILLLVTVNANAIPLRIAIAGAVNQLAEESLKTESVLSSTGVGVVPFQTDSDRALKRGVNEIVTILVEEAVSDSLGFYLVDRAIVKKSLDEIELALSGLGSPDQLRAGAIEEATYLITGLVAETGGGYQVILTLIETSTMMTVATRELSFPASALTVYGDKLVAPFGFYGVFGSFEWAITNTDFGPYNLVAGITAIIPTGKFSYVRPTLECLYAEGNQSTSQIVQQAGVIPELASGTNQLAALIARLGLGSFIPISRAVYIHLGLDLGLGIDGKRLLTRDASGSELIETKLRDAEVCFSGSLDAGVTIRMTERLAFDLQLGLTGKTYGFYLNPDSITMGGLYLPLRISLAIPF